MTTTSETEYVIPALSDQLPADRNQAADQVEQESAAWLRKMTRPYFNSEAEFTRFIAQRNGLFGALAHPHALPERIQAIADWWQLVTVIDDQCTRDHDFAADLGGAQRMFAVFLSILHGNEPEQGFPFAAAVHDVWHRISSSMPLGQRSRFITAAKEGLDGYAEELPWKRRRKLPDMETYLAIRWKSFSAQMLLLLTEYGLGLDLEHDRTVLADKLAPLHEAAMRQAIFVNDIISLRKELEEGFCFNSIAILRQHTGLRLQDAVHAVCALARSYETTYLTRAEHLRTTHAADHPQLATYLDELGYLLGGCMQFEYLTPRYHGTDVTWDSTQPGTIHLNTGPHAFW